MESVQNRTNAMIDSLNQIGIDFNAGMQYCSNSCDIYYEILNVALETYFEKKEKLYTYYQSKDFYNYMIEIHGLKSSMRILGAQSLGDFAEKQEMAIKHDDTTYIEETYEDIIGQYADLMKQIYTVLEKQQYLKEENRDFLSRFEME